MDANLRYLVDSILDAMQVPCRSAWGSGAPVQRCTRVEGHDGMHVDGRGEEFDGTGEWPGNPFRTTASAKR